MPVLVCFGFLTQTDVNSVYFGWVCSSCFDQILLNFAFETTESGLRLPLICKTCARSREHCLLCGWTRVCQDAFGTGTECFTA